MKKATGSSKKKKKFNCLRSDECQSLGFCIWAREREILDQKERDKKYRMDELFIGKLVPLKVEKNTQYHLGDYSKQHLQIAFDAFHQADFESASLHSKAVIQANSDCITAYMCVVAAEYFLGNNEEAADYASRAEDKCYSDYQRMVLQKFVLNCANIISEKAKAKEVTSDKKEKLVKHELHTCQH